MTLLLALGLLTHSEPQEGALALTSTAAITTSTATAPSTALAPSAALAGLVARVEALESALADQESAEPDEGPEALVAAPLLRIYGFLDMGIQRIFAPDTSLFHAVAPTAATTFVLGNLNVYIDAQPSPDWRGLVEIRFTTLPNGVDTLGMPGRPYSRVDTRHFDTGAASGAARTKLGSIVIERAVVQWLHYSWLELTAGAFLTPFGIWNLDHGTPVLISLMLPQLIVGELFPTQQVGLLASGRLFAGEAEVGYHAYVSNGRTPGEFSLSEGNKLAGGRLTLSLRQPFKLTVGMSGYFNHGVDRTREVTSFDPLRFARPEVVAYDEIGEAFDVAADLGALRIRSELAFRQRMYEPGKRPEDTFIPGAAAADQADWDFYFLAAYRLPWAGLEPFVYFEAFRFPNPMGDGFLIPSAGLNVHFTPSVQLKAQFQHGFNFTDLLRLERATGSALDSGLFALRLVLAY